MQLYQVVSGLLTLSRIRTKRFRFDFGRNVADILAATLLKIGSACIALT